MQQQAPVANEPKPGTTVAQPGLLLCDLQAELARAEAEPARVACHEQVVELLDAVRAAFNDEKHDLCAAAELDFDHAVREPLGGHPSAEPTAPRDGDVIVRHRFDAPVTTNLNRTGRVIILRDRRRGRPPNASNRRGSDPPAR